jgi:hypothetical protein
VIPSLSRKVRCYSARFSGYTPENSWKANCVSWVKFVRVCASIRSKGRPCPNVWSHVSVPKPRDILNGGVCVDRRKILKLIEDNGLWRCELHVLWPRSIGSFCVSRWSSSEHRLLEFLYGGTSVLGLERAGRSEDCYWGGNWFWYRPNCICSSWGFVWFSSFYQSEFLYSASK